MLVDWVEDRDTCTKACGRLADLFEQDQGICHLTEGFCTRFCHSHRCGAPMLRPYFAGRAAIHLYSCCRPAVGP